MSATLLWRKATGKKVQCTLCQHRCIIGVGKRGICGVRGNRNGALESLVLQKVASVGLDPVEKKPLYHYKPGSKTFSFGTAGCNFACSFCQNYNISRAPIDSGTLPGKATNADILINQALKYKAKSISYTYNEPTIFFELMNEVASRAGIQDLDSILVTNGYQSPECLSSLYHKITAANVDLKSMREKFYNIVCKAKLAPVLDNLKYMVNMGWWVEITTLLIPNFNDSEEELRDMARFIKEELGPHVPWHISRFQGAYKMQNVPATPQDRLEKARNIGREEGLYYVYIGNVNSLAGAATLCPDCGATCIVREGFLSKNGLKKGCCPKCKRKIEGIW